MKVDWTNHKITDTHARVTFVGSDSKGRTRRTVELDQHDLAALVSIARDFRRHQKQLAQKHNEAGDRITQSGVAL